MATEISAMDNTERDGDPVIRKSVTVPLSQRDAFKLFTEGMSTWWPTRTHSVAGEVARAGMDAQVGGEIYEESADGG